MPISSRRDPAAVPTRPAAAAPRPALFSRQARLHSVLRDAATAEEELLDATGTGAADRVLIVGGSGAELLCASIRRGCRAATGTTVPPRHPDPAEVVLAPRVSSVEEAVAIAAGARRALAAGAGPGRLALALLGQTAAAAAARLVLGLRAAGFAGIRLRGRAAGGLLVTCRLQPPEVAH
ncbi:hypothetical protein [Roseomonas sp. BN140053]|uniref:hypothetical protein n=1 Tax=Roseomonas sp. BN140053 TaxID=3391898 RepID=UPI0039E7DF5C